LGVNLCHPIVTNGESVTSLCHLCGSAYSDRAFVWHDARGGVCPGIHVLDESPYASRGRGRFWHSFRHFAKFRIHGKGDLQHTYDRWLLLSILICSKCNCFFRRFAHLRSNMISMSLKTISVHPLSL